jgi:dienelactone hydrolase
VSWDEERGWIEVGDHRLRCAVTRPRAGGEHPAVLLLPALGARVRTGPLAEAPPGDGLPGLLRAWADAGFVTVRVDPAGVGESGGPAYAEASLRDDVEGHRASLAWVAALPFVARERVFLLGQSLGGALAPLVVEGAAPRPCGVLVYGTPSRRWSDGLAEGARRQLTLAGVPDEVREREAAHAARLYALVLRRRWSPERLRREHPELGRCRAAFDLSERHLHGRALDYFRALDAVDPELAWGRVGAPVLALHGEHDWIVGDDDHTRIAAWVEASGGRAAARTLPGLDHDWLRHESLAASFAGRGRGALDPVAAAETLAWMRAELARTFTREGAAGDTVTSAEGSP